MMESDRVILLGLSEGRVLIWALSACRCGRFGFLVCPKRFSPMSRREQRKPKVSESAALFHILDNGDLGCSLVRFCNFPLFPGSLYSIANLKRTYFSRSVVEQPR